MLKLSEVKMTGYRDGERILKRRLWHRGSPNGWYQNEMPWKKILKKSLLAYIGLELIVYLVVYFIINIIYRAGLDKDAQEKFVSVVTYFKDEASPLARDLTFLLGFYVSLVVKRWWEQYRHLPWPDTLALLNTGLTLYETEEAKFISEELLRYQMLAYVLCLRKISKVIRNEFSTSSDLIEAGLATPTEVKVLEDHGDLTTIWWLPLQWSMHRIKIGKQNKQIPSDHKELLRAVIRFRAELETLESHQHVPIPPVYRQVVHLAVYVYFIVALIANQTIEAEPDIYFPIFLVLKFIFFIGWLKVAEALKNPFGDDGDDFEVAALLSRHIWACGEHLEAGFAGLPEEESPESLVTLTGEKE